MTFTVPLWAFWFAAGCVFGAATIIGIGVIAVQSGKRKTTPKRR